MAVVTAVLFWPAVAHDFVSFDDPVYVTKNPLIYNPTSASFSALSKQIVSLNYHPITMWSMWYDALSGGVKQAQGFIRTNILIHALNAALAFGLAWRLSGRRWGVALITAALFAWHPLRVESVAWVSERKDVLYVLFFLLGSLTYLRYTRSGQSKWLWGAFLFFALSCFSKAMAVVFPVVLLLYDDWEGRPLSRKTVLEKWPFWILAVFIGALTLDVQGGGNGFGLLKAEVEQANALGTARLPFIDRLIAGGYGYMMYWVKSVVPTNLSVFYPYPMAFGGKMGGLHALGVLFMIATLAGAWVMRGRAKYVWFGVAFFFITVVLVLQFLSVGQVMMADRYSYLPAFGFWFMLAYGVEAALLRDKPSATRIWWVTAAALAIGYAAMTRTRLPVWKSTETLWLNVLERYPTLNYARETLGNWYGEQGRIPEAKLQLEAAAQSATAEAPTFSALANCETILMRQKTDTVGRAATIGRIKNLYARAIALEPQNGEHYFNRAVSTFDIDPQSALSDLETAQKLRPDKIGMALLYQGICQINLGQNAAALPYFDRAIQTFAAQPLDRMPQADRFNYQSSYRNRAIARFNSGDKDGARADLEQARILHPQDPELARLKGQMGF